MIIEIHLSGSTAPVMFEPAEDLLRAVAGVEPQRRKLIHDERATKGDPVAVATLILSIPGAILATMDIAERVGIADRICKLLKKVRKSDGEAILQVGSEPALDLKTATEDEVMDLISSQ